jgi:hypothetical protein
MFLRKENDMPYGYVVDNKKYLLNLFVSFFCNPLIPSNRV